MRDEWQDFWQDFWRHPFYSLRVQAALGALLVTLADATLLIHAFQRDARSSWVQPTLIIATTLWFGVLVWAIYTDRQQRRRRRGGGDPRPPTPPRGPGGRAQPLPVKTSTSQSDRSDRSNERELAHEQPRAQEAG